MSAGKKRRREGTVTAPSLEDVGVPESIRRRLDNHGLGVESLAEGGSVTESVVETLRKHGVTDDTVLRSFRGNWKRFVHECPFSVTVYCQITE